MSKLLPSTVHGRGWKRTKQLRTYDDLPDPEFTSEDVEELLEELYELDPASVALLIASFPVEMMYTDGK